MSETVCPNCGAKARGIRGFDGYLDFSCGSYVYKDGEPLIETVPCLRNQLAQRDARVAKLLDELEYQRQMAVKAELRVAELEGLLKDAGAALLRIQKSRAAKHALEAAQAESE